jgi:hexosaminidase
MKPVDLPLVPRPKLVDIGRFEAGRIGSEPNVHIEPSLTRPAEYKLTLSPRGPFIVAGGPDGVRAAEHTLDKLRAIAKSRPKDQPLPIVLVEDWADHAHRGFMLDVSRDRIPTMDELERLVTLLARLGFNELQLYVEHVFAFPGHEAVWGALDPLTPDEIRRLDGWCQAAGIELVANQNCFGHLAGVLRTPGYEHLAETHGTFRFLDFEKQGPFSLCPEDPGSLELVDGWLRTIAEVYSSRRVHIGCDETFDVGQGRSRAAVEARSRSQVYADFVAAVAGRCEAHGLEPMFWADIALADEAAFTALPKDLVAVAWGYEPDSPFERWCETLDRLDRPYLIAPGTSCWRTFCGRTSERRANLAAASAAAADSNAAGLLVAAWGDLGHRQVWPITLRAVCDAAEACWNAGSEGADPEATARVAFRERDGAALVEYVDALGDLDADLRDAADGRAVLGNAAATFSELFPATATTAPRGSLAQWERVAAEFDLLVRDAPLAHDRLVAAELADAALWTGFAIDVALWRRRGREGTGRGSLLERLDALVLDQRELWPRRARRPGLEHSLAHVAALRTRLENEA